MTAIGPGIDVSPLALGGTTFGWTSDEATSRQVLDRFLHAGGNLIDTSDSYSAFAPGNSGGESETIIGAWMAARGNRDRVVIGTKVSRHPEFAGLSAANVAAAERDAALAAAGEKVPRRRARLLPPWLAVYLTLALCLLARLPYQDVLRSLAGDGAAGLAVPATTALTAARRRLGERPLELLFWRVTGVLLPSRDPWATVGGLLVTAWDGTTLKVPATAENIAALGRPRHGGGRKAPAGGKKGKDGKAPAREGHYPQMRAVALIACGTRALLGAAFGPLADGEQKLAATLTRCLRPGMLLLADRGFWSLAL